VSPWLNSDVEGGEWTIWCGRWGERERGRKGTVQDLRKKRIQYAWDVVLDRGGGGGSSAVTKETCGDRVQPSGESSKAR